MPSRRALLAGGAATAALVGGGVGTASQVRLSPVDGTVFAVTDAGDAVALR